MKKLNEFKASYPSLKKIFSMSYTDPRVETEGKKICSEKSGDYSHGEKLYKGHYIVYNDAELPGKFIGIHVSNEINEETGDPIINVIAIDKNKNSVVRRMNYRMKKSYNGDKQVLVDEDEE